MQIHSCHPDNPDNRGNSLPLVLPSTAPQRGQPKPRLLFRDLPARENPLTRQRRGRHFPRRSGPAIAAAGVPPEGASCVAIVRTIHGQAGCERRTLASLLQSLPVLLHASSFRRNAHGLLTGHVVGHLVEDLRAEFANHTRPDTLAGAGFGRERTPARSPICHLPSGFIGCGSSFDEGKTV